MMELNAAEVRLIEIVRGVPWGKLEIEVDKQNHAIIMVREIKNHKIV